MAVFESGDPTVDILLHALIVLAVIFVVVEYFIYKKQESVATNLILAERDFNNLVAGGLAHGGRKDRVAERREWSSMIDPQAIQVNKEGYKSIIHDLIAANEKELGGKGATMGKASMTAFLLRELYEGNVEAAQAKIYTDTKNSDGKPPYIAPGIYDLVGFDQFDPKTGFPKGAGVNEKLLKRVVKYWKFPRDIRMTEEKDGVKSFRDPFDALNQLIQQNI